MEAQQYQVRVRVSMSEVTFVIFGRDIQDALYSVAHEGFSMRSVIAISEYDPRYGE